MNYTVYNLIKAPNQMFNTNIGDNNFEFTFRTFRGMMYASVRINGELECAGVKCTPNANLFPDRVNEIAGGVFAFLCLKNEYPSYEQFDGVATRFAFCTYSELSSK